MAASTAAATSALTNVGRGSGNTAAFDMSAGGDNFFVARDDAALAGSLSYTGGSGDDSLTFEDYLAYDGGTATFDMFAGGNNHSDFGNVVAADTGSIAYKGGAGDDSLVIGNGLAARGVGAVLLRRALI